MIWVWIWLAWLGTFGLLNNFSLWLSSNFWTHFFQPIMFQRNLWWITRWRKNSLAYDCSSFHPNNFRDIISWEWCFVKNDSVRSCLIELQSFIQSKVDVDPIHHVLMFLPCFMHVLCMTRYTQIDHIKILVIFVHKINKQKEYGLSLAQTLTSKYESRTDDRMQIERTSDMIYVMEETVRMMTLSCKVGSMRLRPWRARRYKIVPNESVQYWCFSCFRLLLPCCSSTFRQTNDDNTQNDP